MAVIEDLVLKTAGIHSCVAQGEAVQQEVVAEPLSLVHGVLISEAHYQVVDAQQHAISNGADFQCIAWPCFADGLIDLLTI